MNGKNRTYWRFLIITLVLMLGGSLLASWVNTGAGAATVQDIKFHGSNGYTFSAYLYTPKGVSAMNPAPAIMLFHGLNNQKDYMDNTALEFARRGYVVLSADMTGHGYSSGLNGEDGYGGPDTLNYLRSLPIVDKDNIGLVGMSQGGFGPVTAAANAIPDGYTSIFYMESECTPPGSMDITPCNGLKNVAFNIGSFTELSGMVMVGRGADAVVSPVIQPVFNTTDPIVPGKMYGSVADGTARILYQPFEEHAGSTNSPAAIGNAITWMETTLKGGTGLPGTNQIWGWKLFGTAAALLGALLFFFPMGALLLQTSFFQPLVEKVPAFKGFTGIGWWIGALITTAVGPLVYFWAWAHEFAAPLIPANSIWPQSFTNVYMLWTIAVGVIAIILIFFNHYVFTKKQGATAVNYGLAWEGKGVDWGKVGKSILLSLSILAPLYLLLAFIHGVFFVDFRAWVVALMPMSPNRFQAFLGYLIPFALFYVPQGILFAGFLRVNSGKASLAREMVTNAVVLTLGALVWILMLYIPLMAGGTQIIASAATGPMGGTFAGMGGIYYLPMLILFPLAACLYTYFFRKTGRVYVGVSLVTLFIVWLLAAFGVFAAAI